jgi:hypothetical protein
MEDFCGKPVAYFLQIRTTTHYGVLVTTGSSYPMEMRKQEDPHEWDRGFRVVGGADSSALGNLEACGTELAKDPV